MKKLALALAATMALSLSNISANAADMPPPVLNAPPMPWVEVGSNWYLRGDFTYRTFDVPGTDGPEDAAALGVGVGYQYNSWLRGDVTLDYQFASKFALTDAANVAGAKLWSSALFANGYIDLGTWYGVTPYIGAGVGTAYNHLDDNGRWNFAWAAMVGAAYQLSPNLSFDFGYRYADLGSAIALDNSLVDVTAHEFKVGFRYKLD
ncbi:MAG: porin family protein [Xanthobacteraceae bacterium]|nr:porin family protein [Xanthobacteraceae bacterium]